VRIVKNREGTFGFEEWHLDGDAYGIRWIPAGQKIRTFADTAEVAEREARAGVDWLVEERLD
jgi:hypothetical protein